MTATQDELLDYEHDEDEGNHHHHASLSNGDVLINNDGDEDREPESVLRIDVEVNRKPTPFAGHVSLHSTGFQDMMLKPELLKAISEAGFEHPSGEEKAGTAVWWRLIEWLIDEPNWLLIVTLEPLIDCLIMCW